MTSEIADAIVDELNPDGCGVIVEASHTCMTIRGVTKPDSVMITSAMRGGFKNRPATRAEFIAIVHHGKGDPQALRWGAHAFTWGARTYVMAILNATPDSFSGDGIDGNIMRALAQAEQAVADGADIIDVGRRVDPSWAQAGTPRMRSTGLYPSFRQSLIEFEFRFPSIRARPLWPKRRSKQGHR